jgi:hypothetical protein
MGDAKAIDMMVATLSDPFGVGHMGVTAENLAKKWNISREEQDAFSVESQRRAGAAIAEGRFKSQIVPIVMKTRKGDVVFDTDEHVKAGTTIEALAKMKPAFIKDGTVTAGNASGINDGAAFLMLAAADVAAQAGQKPIARLVAYAIAGVPNEIMGEGPIPASKLVLKKAGLTLDQMDVIEANEAFAAQAIAVNKGLGLDPVKTNPNGGAIALGHPVGCSGAFIATKAIYELQRTGGKYALVTMCIGGGQGIAVIFERALMGRDDFRCSATWPGRCGSRPSRPGAGRAPAMACWVSSAWLMQPRRMPTTRISGSLQARRPGRRRRWVRPSGTQKPPTPSTSTASASACSWAKAATMCGSSMRRPSSAAAMCGAMAALKP